MSATEKRVQSDISVVICAYTEERWHDLVAAVESLQQQSSAPHEIIVVIDHNPRLLYRVQEHIPGVIVLANGQAKGLSGARNSGAASAQGDVVAFLDDDACADPHWIEHLAECYTDPQVAGVGGRIEPLWSGTRPAWFPPEFNWVVGCTYKGMPLEPAPVRNMIGANMSLRRGVLHAVGGFRLSFGCDKGSSSGPFARWLRHHAGDEETEFCIRVARSWPNNTLLYAPSAVVHHRVSEGRMRWRYFAWRCYDEGLGKAALVKLHGAQTSLSSERSYTSRTLPAGIVRNMLAFVARGDLSALTRAAAIGLGFAATVAGYIVGSIYQLAHTEEQETEHIATHTEAVYALQEES